MQVTPETAAHADAILEVHALYMEACDHDQAHPDDAEGISQRVDIMLGRSMDLFMHDLASVTQDTARVMFRRTWLEDHRVAQLAAEGLVPYNRPITLDELKAEPPGMVPLLLARATFCRAFHSMPIRTKFMMNWKRFVVNYAQLIPRMY